MKGRKKMNRVMMVVLAVLLVFLASPLGGPATALGQQEASGFLYFQDSIPRQIVSAEVVKTLAQVDTFVFVPFSPGGSRDLPNTEKARFDQIVSRCDQVNTFCFFIGMSDIMSWRKPYTEREEHRLNRSLADARAKWAKDRAGKGTMLTSLVDQPLGMRGFYAFVANYEPIAAAPVTAMPTIGLLFLYNELQMPVEVTVEHFDTATARVMSAAAELTVSDKNKSSLEVKEGFYKVTWNAPGHETEVALIYVEAGRTTPFLLDLKTEPQPSFLAELHAGGGIGVASLLTGEAGIDDFETTVPTVSAILVYKRLLYLTATFGWWLMPAQDDDSFGDRDKRFWSIELSVYPTKSWWGLALGFQDVRENDLGQDGFLERSSGITLGPRVRLFNDHLVLGLDGKFSNRSRFGRLDAFGREDSWWELGISPRFEIRHIFRKPQR
jgi:hypothetical protein